MVDAAIVMIENAHKHLERAPSGKLRAEVLTEAAVEVGPRAFFSLLIITVSFLPIFALEAQEGRLFKPLAFTKTFAMAAAALLSVTAVPAFTMLFVCGRIIPEHRNPVNRFLVFIYRPLIRFALRFRALCASLPNNLPAIEVRHELGADAAGRKKAGREIRSSKKPPPVQRATLLSSSAATAGTVSASGKRLSSTPSKRSRKCSRRRGG
jgi:Cu(I)/Ag(I) efflux system membrane protein CusA/SilA